MKQSWSRAAVAVLAVATASVLCLTGCEKGGGGGGGKPVAVAGTWKGPFTLSLQGMSRSGVTTLVLAQNEKNVSGRMGAIPVAGTVNGNKISLQGAAGGFTLDIGGPVNGNVMSLTGTMKGGGYTIGYVATLTRVAGKEAVAVEGEDLKTAAEALIKAAQ